MRIHTIHSGILICVVTVTLSSGCNRDASQSVVVKKSVTEPIISPNSAHTPNITTKPSSIVGQWKQYAYDTDGSIYLGIFAVSKQGNSYSMSAYEQPTNSINSVGLYDVDYDGKNWSFKSNWANGEKGTFKLHKVSNTVFEGDVLSNGRIVDKNRWIKIR